MEYVGYVKKDTGIYIRNIRHHYNGLSGRGIVEHLHQIRVNARRLRNALSIHKKIFPARQLQQWDKSIRRAVEASSQARDLDVYLRFLNVYARKPRGIPERRVLAAFIAALEKKRERLQPRVIRDLNDFNRRNTLEDIARSLRHPIAGKKDNDPQKIYKVARKKLLRRVKELLVFEPFVRRPRRIRELHQMRIAAKHLRYTLEGFAPLYGPRLSLFIGRVLSFHRQLGDIHDYDVWTEHLARYARLKVKSRKEMAVLNKVKRHCLGLRQRTYRVFVRNWSTAREKNFFEDLMEYVYAH
ncbi:MAG TPA: hypothetical protein DE315_08020 [Candidatus Omnitrophica bacterium]|nr:hypothetical protein [Candidatus Omnitrophota bacterium]HCI45458.1 hypothetical protein [Candidatus Omnitrophota bacterium]